MQIRFCKDVFKWFIPGLAVDASLAPWCAARAPCCLIDGSLAWLLLLWALRVALPAEAVDAPWNKITRMGNETCQLYVLADTTSMAFLCCIYYMYTGCIATPLWTKYALTHSGFEKIIMKQVKYFNHGSNVLVLLVLFLTPPSAFPVEVVPEAHQYKHEQWQGVYCNRSIFCLISIESRIIELWSDESMAVMSKYVAWMMIVSLSLLLHDSCRNAPLLLVLVDLVIASFLLSVLRWEMEVLEMRQQSADLYTSSGVMLMIYNSEQR